MGPEGIAVRAAGTGIGACINGIDCIDGIDEVVGMGVSSMMGRSSS
jgi:hypothetical protein